MPFSFSFFSDEKELESIRREFEGVFELYKKYNYPENLDDTLMCSIHDLFGENDHNCVACNLEQGSKLIINYLKNYNQFGTAEAIFPHFILCLYLLVEKIEEYLNIMEVQKGVREKNFKVFSKIRHWSNFIKHPKAFMLVHHPNYVFDKIDYPDDFWRYRKKEDYEIIIDNDFVKEYYSSKNNNSKLYGKLTNKDDVLVIYPRPLELIKAFCEAQKYFVNLICDNKVFRDFLEGKATKYYQRKDSEG